LAGEEAELAGLLGPDLADHVQGGVAGDVGIDPRRALLGAQQQDAEAAPPAGDVDQQVFDGAAALAGPVLVELVEQDPGAPGVAAVLVVLPDAGQQGADDEALGGVVEGVDVDDADGVAEADGAQPGADDGTEAGLGGPQPAHEGLDGGRGHAAHPAGAEARRAVDDLVGDELHQLGEVADDDAVGRGQGGLRDPGGLGPHPGHDQAAVV